MQNNPIVGEVVDNDLPGKNGQLKIRIPEWHHPDTPAEKLPAAIPVSMSSFINIPRIGSWVYIANKDPNQPMYGGVVAEPSTWARDLKSGYPDVMGFSSDTIVIAVNKKTGSASIKTITGTNISIDMIGNVEIRSVTGKVTIQAVRDIMIRSFKKITLMSTLIELCAQKISFKRFCASVNNLNPF